MTVTGTAGSGRAPLTRSPRCSLSLRRNGWVEVMPAARSYMVSGVGGSSGTMVFPRHTARYATGNG